MKAQQINLNSWEEDIRINESQFELQNLRPAQINFDGNIDDSKISGSALNQSESNQHIKMLPMLTKNLFNSIDSKDISLNSSK